MDLVPRTEQTEQIGSLIENLEINNRLILHLESNDENLSKDSLIIIADLLSEQLLANDSLKTIQDLGFNWSGGKESEVFDYFYKYLPFYLEEQDYAEIELLFSDTSIEQTTAAVYRNLVSPMGSFSGSFTTKDPFGLTQYPLNRLKALNKNENLEVYKGHLFSKSGNELLGFIELAYNASNTDINRHLIKSIQDNQREFQTSFPFLEIGFFGSSAIAVENAKQVRKDIILTVSLAASILVILILLFFRRLTVLGRIAIPAILGVSTAITFIFFFNQSVSIISIAIGSVLLGISIDFSLHFLIHSQTERDLKALLRSISQPVLISGITTATAFFSLMFLNSSAMKELGTFAGISTFSAAVYTLVYLPLLEPKKPALPVSWADSILNKVSSLQYHKKWLSWVVLIVVTTISVAYWDDVEFESDLQKLGYMPEKFEEYRQEINEISDLGSNTAFIAVADTSAFRALEKMPKIDSALSVKQNEGQILSYVSFSQIIPEKSKRDKRLKLWNSFWEKRDRTEFLNRFQKSAESYGFSEMAFEDFAQLVKLDSLSFNEDDFQVLPDFIGNGALTIKDGNDVALLSVINTTDSAKTKMLQDLSKVENAIILDRGYITYELIKLLRKDFSSLVNISLLAVFIIMLLSYGRIELAIISFIPIALSWLWVLGIMSLFSISFNITNVIVCTFIFGLGVDYSVFQLQAYLEEYRNGKVVINSFRKSILLSVITTLVGMGVLLFAKHPAIKSIAPIAIIGMASVVFITFTVQPLLYDFLIGNRKKRGFVPYTAKSFFLSVVAFTLFLIGCLILNLAVLIFRIPLGSKDLKQSAVRWLLSKFSMLLLYLMVNVKKVVKGKSDSTEPTIVIANHHSFIDILVMLMMSPKQVIVTNDWVYNSPFFGTVVKYAGFICASHGLEESLDKIKALVDKGISIVVFPEGTRSPSQELQRFHKGAFFLAEKLELDIQPVLIHGTAMVMPKGDDFYLKSSQITACFLPRIKKDDKTFGVEIKDRTKSISRHFKEKFKELREEIETTAYFKGILVKNYIYKGPVLEWYLRIKLKFEDDYLPIDKLVPAEADILDLGGGYGFMAQSLAMASSRRRITSLDYDEQKITVARNVPALPKNIRFIVGDVMKHNFESKDVYLISDVLHYLKPEEQVDLLHSLSSKLNSGGRIILRDADSGKTDRHKGSKLTEFFSTKLIRFNKTRNKLHYISSDFIKDFASSQGLEMKIIDNSKRTSNLIFVLDKK